MAKRYTATITYTIYPDENGLLESDYDILDEDELTDNHRTPDELIKYVREEMYEIITNGVLKERNIWEMIEVEVGED
jgi:hypothetical protein